MRGVHRTFSQLLEAAMDDDYSDEFREKMRNLAYLYRQAVDSFISESDDAKNHIKEFEEFEASFEENPVQISCPWKS